MFTNWTVENFKSIFDKTTIDLKPLTIFAGANSSGKSTILQSILLTAQTLQSPVHSRSVVLNGHIVRLGAFSDIASSKNEHKKITLGFTLEPSKEGNKSLNSNQTLGVFPYYSQEFESKAGDVSCSFSFGCSGTDAEREAQQLQPQLTDSQVKVLIHNDGVISEHEVHTKRTPKNKADKIKSLGLTKKLSASTEEPSLEFDVIRPTSLKSIGRRYLMETPSSGTLAGAIHAHFLPARISAVYDTIEEYTRKLVDTILNPRSYSFRDGSNKRLWEEAISPNLHNDIVENLRKCVEINATPATKYRSQRLERFISILDETFSLENYTQLFSALPEEIIRLYSSSITEKAELLRSQIKTTHPPQYNLRFIPLAAEIDYASTYIRSYFSNQVKYLGPLRDEPKPVYPLSGATDPRDVGFRGEHTAAVLDIHKHTVITYISPAELSSAETPPRARSSRLIDAVADWLNYLGVVSNVVTTDKGKLGHELKVSTADDGDFHDLTHVGVGVSQVLPILVMALLCDTDSVLIFEQPELHLHPRVQTRLADFFVSMSLLKKQCLVETHSEYLINRLRYLASASAGERVCNDTIIYFVEKTKGHTQYRPIFINEFGVIEDWPQGFFDENEETSAAILRIAMERRQKSKK